MKTTPDALRGSAPALGPQDVDALAHDVAWKAKYRSGHAPLSWGTPQAYQAAAASIEERLLDRWDATFSHFEKQNPKMASQGSGRGVRHEPASSGSGRVRGSCTVTGPSTGISASSGTVRPWRPLLRPLRPRQPPPHFSHRQAYYLSMEYLQGRALANAVRNIGMKDAYAEVLDRFGSKLEEVEDSERDPGLGNGGLGRLASCFLDSVASCDLPGWGYGLRYKYGLFKQIIQRDGQIEVPEDWLDVRNPWEARRADVRYPVSFGGSVDNGTWIPDETFDAVAYDTPIPGYRTTNTISLRLWDAESTSQDFGLAAFNAGHHLDAIRRQARASEITAVLYPADGTRDGKALRLRQQFLLCSASVQDIMATYKRRNGGDAVDWSGLPGKVAIQMNDTHPTLATPELMRLLMDCEGLGWTAAWTICKGVVNYTNHTVLPEALEKWPLDLLEELLPRHVEIIRKIHSDFLSSPEVAALPKEARQAMAILGNIDVDTGEPLKTIRWMKGTDPKTGMLSDSEQPYEVDADPVVAMANLCCVAAGAVNGVAALHSEIVKDEVFNDFYKLWPHKFQNKTNGVTPRRWLAWCNPELSDVITRWLKTDAWIQDLDLLAGLVPLADDPKLQAEWRAAKQANKASAAAWLKAQTGFDLPVDAMYDVQVKRIHEYKRQLLNALALAHRYKAIKDTPAAERKSKFVPKVCMIGGKAFATYEQAKRIVRLIVQMSDVINNDPDCDDLLKVVFLPNYNVTVAEHVIPATELCHQISTAGMEASGTSNMKFMMNGSLTVGTLDGANVEIRECAGAENFFLFGAEADEIAGIRRDRGEGKFVPSPEFEAVKAFVRSGVFGADDDSRHTFDQLCGSLEGNEGFGRADYFCVGYDFPSYLKALDASDALYRDQAAWTRASIINTATSGKFSSDRTIRQYASEIWGIEPCRVPDQ